MVMKRILWVSLFMGFHRVSWVFRFIILPVRVVALPTEKFDIEAYSITLELKFKMKRCVECGFLVKSLYTQYGEGNLVLDLCSNCKGFVDPYIEHSPLLLLIEVFLLKPSVYRHLLFNSNQINRSYPFTTIGVSLLSLESMFLTLDEIENWKISSIGVLIKTFVWEFSKLFIFFISLSLISSIFLMIRDRPIYLSSFIKTSQLVFNATLFSLIPSLLLLSFTLIFRDSYGSLSPHHTSSLSHLPLTIISSYPSLSIPFDHHQLEETLRNGIGIDMDRLGSVELKQSLIRGIVRNLSTSIGLSISLNTTCWIGGFLLTFSSVIHHLFLLPIFDNLRGFVF
ncbi:Arv1-like family-domain-containing protein [Melampsora americana]|nr:Arv1-like family-domain-containing protein [Melampsora americana]